MARNVQPTSLPNVIFLITHDVGPVYGCYGNGEIHSPNIDRLAEESVRFDSHYCQWPLCGPSRANIFSGCRPLTTRRFNNQPFFEEFRRRAPDGFESLPEHFAHAGSSSRGIGWVYHDNVDDLSWSLGHALPQPDTEPLPEWAEGWFTRDELNEWKAPASRELMRQRLTVLKNAGMTQEEFRKPDQFRRARGPAFESADVNDDAYYDGKAARLACEFLERHPDALVDSPNGSRAESGTPYFLGVGFVAPHTPFRAPSRYWNLYDRAALTLHPNREWPRGSADWMAGDSEPAQYYTTDGYTKPWRPSETQLRELLHGHYATISYLDALVGKIINTAQRRSDWDNTLVVLTSDHGFSEGQHGYWGKHNMWDASLRVPLLMRIPGRKGLVSHVPRVTEHVDIYPTLCDVAGIPTPEYCGGRSLVPLLSDPHIPWKDAALSHRKHMWHDRQKVYDLCNSLRTSRHRYTEYLDGNGDILGRELFDYGDDPLESRNLAAEPEYATDCEALAARLRDAVRSAGRSL